MRIFIHDYVGHPFQVTLSRELARRGHEVRHAYNQSFSTPRGDLVVRPGDPAGFSVLPIELGEMIPKEGYVRRFRLESKYGKLIAQAVLDYQPDVVLSGNTPSIPQCRLTRTCRRHGIRHVFWVQDVYGVAAHKLLSKRVPVVGSLAGKYFIRLDQQTARSSDALVVITDDFAPLFQSWGVPAERIHTIHNWSVLEDLPPRPRNNAWSQELGLGDEPRVIYTGTLGMKHNPALLLEIARLLDERGRGRLIVVSEGAGIDWLRGQAEAAGLRTLACLPFQPFDKMADALGSADVLVAILEPDAGVFSVPSKVLSYMCAGRALLGAMPANNLAARLIVENNAGLVTDPNDLAAFRAAAAELLDSPQLLPERGAAARRYAEENFDISRIADRFGAILAAR